MNTALACCDVRPNQGYMRPHKLAIAGVDDCLRVAAAAKGVIEVTTARCGTCPVTLVLR